jgi:hypothetical protein
VFGIDSLSAAIRSLAANVLALSETTAAINTHLRARLSLDAPEPEPPALPGPEPEAETNGKARRRPARVE